MGIALVIKGANFSANKVTTVQLEEVVPCTGLTLSPTTISFTSIGATQQLTATKTPVNTTDSVVWNSSNTNVATVSDSGLVTCVGVGDAVITAGCGSMSATCSVSATVTLYTDDLLYILHSEASGTDISVGKDYCGSYSGGSKVNYNIMFLSNITTPYKACSGGGEEQNEKYPIMIPPNTATIVITGTNANTLDVTRCSYFNSTLQPSYNISSKGTRAVTNYQTLTGLSSLNRATYEVPTDVPGLDSVVLTMRFTEEISDAPSGVKIEFLPAEVS